MVSSQLHYTKVNRFMPFLLAEILNFQGSTHRIGVGSFSYVKIGGDYNDILHRFMNENMIHKFVLKFPQDNNMALFEESWAKKDYKTAFRAMHTLKGVAVNLGFTALYNVSSALTEKLRSQEYDNLDGLIADVKKQYDIVIEAIAALD